MSDYWRDRINSEDRLEALRERMLSGVPVSRDVLQRQILDELKAIRKLLEQKKL